MANYYSSLYININATENLIEKLKEYYGSGAVDAGSPTINPGIVGSLSGMISEKKAKHQKDSHVMSALSVLSAALKNTFDTKAPTILIGESGVLIFKEDFDIGYVKEEAEDLSSFLNCPVIYTYSCFDYVIYGVYCNGETTSGIKSNDEFPEDPYIDDFDELLLVDHEKFLKLGNFVDADGSILKQLDSIQSQDEMEEFLKNILNTDIRYDIENITNSEDMFEKVFYSKKISIYKPKK